MTARFPLLAAIAALLSFALPARAADVPDFGRDILPILSDKCFHCHGPDQSARKAELRLDVREGILASRGGTPAVVPGKPDASELVARISSVDPDVQMPPPSSNRHLSAADVDKLKRWVAGGAPWGKHWAFEPLRKPALPSPRDATWARRDFDRYILARLEREQQIPSAPASRETWLRRVTLDLSGL
ncbi:MAG TPA: c-type cytochrome domain-containing protein, partial [Planctomycetia bacterium]|nr:c-type cytochrome domain-containing protein [Planctomycetia bacterium]